MDVDLPILREKDVWREDSSAFCVIALEGVSLPTCHCKDAWVKASLHLVWSFPIMWALPVTLWGGCVGCSLVSISYGH